VRHRGTQFDSDSIRLSHRGMLARLGSTPAIHRIELNGNVSDCGVAVGGLRAAATSRREKLGSTARFFQEFRAKAAEVRT
jgi:hypothetical protein